jgi:predicted ester cyclase
MDLDEMKRIDSEVGAAISSGDLDAFDDLMSPQLAASFKEDIAELRRAFPDYGGTNERQVAEVDTVATRFLFYGTHQGEFFGVAPTGKRITFAGLSMSRFAEGRMVDTIVEMDWLEVLRQLGYPGLPNEE